MNNFDYKNLTPFKWFVLENFPFIENDFDAINNYHLFSKVVEYLNKTIDSMNLTGEQMENVTNAMTDLQNYVNNYLENIDIQEDVNNKLDEMAEDGTLAKIINQEIFQNIINTQNEILDTLETGKMIVEFPFISYNVQGFTNSNNVVVEGSCFAKINNERHIFVAIENSYNGDFGIIDFNCENQNVTEYNITSVFTTTPGSLNSMAFDKIHNHVLLTYNNEIYAFNPYNMTLENRYTIQNLPTGTTIHGISFNEENELYILSVLSTGKINNIYKLNDTFTQCEYITSINFEFSNVSYFQDFIISNNKMYIVHSNTIAIVNMKNYEVLGILPSKLKYCEYESLIDFDGSICATLNMYNSRAIAIVQTNLTKNYLGTIIGLINPFTRYHLYANSESNGFFENGLSDLPIHSNEFALYYALTYNMSDIWYAGNFIENGFGLSIREANLIIHILTDKKMYIDRIQNSRIEFIEGGKIAKKGDGIFTNNEMYFTGIIIDDNLSLNNSKIVFSNNTTINGIITGSFNNITLNSVSNDILPNKIKVAQSKFQGSLPQLLKLSLFENPAGYLDGSVVNWNLQNASEFSNYDTNGMFMAEVSKTSNGTINGYVLMHNSKSHPGMLIGSGVYSDGSPIFVSMTGGANLVCKIGGNSGYCMRIYPIN